ncbi:sterol desaturase family protein [Paucibacter sp. XJ19-41]|uniref:sterol desaturase family protein n=1 Tax=Paucibacter sp. XJ19-41 TaxID=2927824 RepID=UPI00234BE606|nr:sterol desaturase family protein [Paucibacter sp. XJ19-41]MDC6169738.1 sterol desaturase family protein [Paucibacter sp. XJ19-41]
MNFLLLKRIYAPLMLIGWNAAALTLVMRGGPGIALLPLLLGAVACSFLAERWIPYEPRWNQAHGDRWRDTAHALVNEGLSLMGVLAIPLLAALRPWPSIWPTDWPLALQWLLALLVADAGITLTHWASHRLPWLWRFHAVHHSVERLYGFNGLMKHPVHLAIETAAGTAPLLLLGMPQQVAALLAFSVALQLLLQHANVDMRIGALRHLLALAPVHRFHHLKWVGTGDVNFGLFTTLWDRLLGSAHDEPGRRFRPGDFGIGTAPDYPKSYLAQLLAPWR